MPGPHPPDFDCITARLDHPMTIVTVTDGHERSGCLVGFGTQCSLEPPRYLVCISKANHTHGVAMEASMMVIHFPHADQRDLARVFGEETGDEVDKFAPVAWHPGPDGRTPVLDDCPAWFAGRVLSTTDAGDHTGFLLEPTDASCADGDWEMLQFQRVKDLEAGHPVEPA
ncbi:MAG TPA: flavin reductase family protein [Acidimicrobiales bacterium]|nr:flavin reductase family protein [Acidimicrobiales bacterium]